MNGRDQQFSSAQVAARALFSCGITAVVVISTYYGMLWLFARADYRQAGARSMTKTGMRRSPLVKGDLPK